MEPKGVQELASDRRTAPRVSVPRRYTKRFILVYHFKTFINACVIDVVPSV
jgi:hypothetical protein